MTTPNQKRDKSKDLALLGTTFAGKYRVLELLGQGGFGSVFLVEITAGMVGEKLAMKLVPGEFSGDEKVKGQFLNEIRVAMRMVNKYIVQIRDVGETEDGQLYYTMDYCPGETLASMLKREGALPPARAIPLALRILEALKTAHAAGVIHRDLKPANVMVFSSDGHETLRVLDFGIATATRAGKPKGAGFLGSPHYMPPEQFLNDALGFYTDTYSVGVILYECLTGQKPYQGRTAQEVYNDLKSRPVVPPGEINPALAAYPGLSEVITRALERNPELRYPLAKDLFNDLKAVLEGTFQAAPAPTGRAGGAGAAPVVRRRRTAVARSSSSQSMASGVAIAIIAAVGGIVALYLMLRTPDSPPEGAATRGREKTVVKAAPQPVAPDPDDSELEDPPPTSLQPAPPSPRPNLPPPPPGGTPGAGSAAGSTAASSGAKAAVTDPAVVQREAEARSRQLISQAAEEARKGERWDKVREVCMDAIGLGHSSAEAFRLKGLAELRLGMFEEAVQSLTEARVQTPREKADSNLFLLLIEAHAGRPDSDPDIMSALLGDLLAALKLQPGHKEGTVKALALLEARGSEKELIELLERARAARVEDPLVERLHQKYLVDLPRERENRAQELLKDARRALDSRDTALAAGKAEEGFRLKPIPELGFILAEARLEAGKIGEAHTALGVVSRQVAEDSEALARLGVLYGRAYLDEAGDSRKTGEALAHAVDNLDAAIEALKDPKVKSPYLVAAAHTYRARCYAHQLNLSKVDEELKVAKNALDRDTELIYHQAGTYYLLGEKTKDPDRSAAYLRGIQRLTWYNDFKDTKREPKGYFLMGLCYLRLGGKKDNFDQAIDKFAKAQRFGMKDSPSLLAAMAESYAGLGDHIKAGQLHRTSFEISPSEESCLKSAASFLEANNKISAGDILKKGRERYPRSTKIQNLLQSLGR